jgi:hypothetical protein
VIRATTADGEKAVEQSVEVTADECHVETESVTLTLE